MLKFRHCTSTEYRTGTQFYSPLRLAFGILASTRNSLLLETEVTDVVLGVWLVAAAVLADVVAAIVALATSVEDESEHLTAPDAAVLVELGLLRQHLGLTLLLLQ